MKVYSWNVNGIRAVHRKGALDEFIKKESPDILLIQEIKAQTDKLPEEILDENKFIKFFNPAEKAGYSGVSIWVSREFENDIDKFSKGIPKFRDNEGRVAIVNLKNGLTIVSVYVQNGGKSEEAFKEKISFIPLLSKFAKELESKGRDILIGGDFNVAMDEIDLAQPEKFQNHTHFCMEARNSFKTLLDDTFIDTFRERNKNLEGAYTYWDNFDFSLPRGTKPREVNRGWRLDYLFAGDKLNKRIKEAKIHSGILGSDHCPISVSIN